MRNRKIYQGFAAVAAALAASGAVAPAGADEVTDDQVADARRDERRTTKDIASMDARLAQLNAKANGLKVRKAQAEAKSIAAQQELSTAISQAVSAQEAANRADAKVAEGRKRVGRVARAYYREGSASLKGTGYVFGAGSVSESNRKARAYGILNKKTNADLEKFEAEQTKAATLQASADAKAKDQASKASEAQRAFEESSQAASTAQSQLASIGTERDRLIGRLAEQKGVTAELVRQQQEQKEAAANVQAAAQQQQIIAAAQAKAAAEAQNDAHGDAAESAQSADPVQPAESGQQAQPAQSGQSAEPAQSAEPSQPVQPAQPAPDPAATRPAGQPAQASRRPAASARKQPAQQPVRKPAQQPVRQQPAPAAPAQGSGMGAQVVAYARQFAGVRYVWGGTSPAKGWDCVGFTHYVYSHFGVSTPRRTGGSVGQFWGGYRIVPASQRQPGDLMWWPGHVGIYTGNGMHIAAWNPSMGTQERAVWGRPTYLRVLG